MTRSLGLHYSSVHYCRISYNVGSVTITLAAYEIDGPVFESRSLSDFGIFFRKFFRKISEQTKNLISRYNREGDSLVSLRISKVNISSRPMMHEKNNRGQSQSSSKRHAHRVLSYREIFASGRSEIKSSLSPPVRGTL